MKKIWLSVALASSSLFLTACNDDHDDTSAVVIDDGIPKYDISQPLVMTPENYTLSNMPAVAGQSVKMTYKMLGVNGSEVQATSCYLHLKQHHQSRVGLLWFGHMVQQVWQYLSPVKHL